MAAPVRLVGESSEFWAAGLSNECFLQNCASMTEFNNAFNPENNLKVFDVVEAVKQDWACPISGLEIP